MNLSSAHSPRRFACLISIAFSFIGPHVARAALSGTNKRPSPAISVNTKRADNCPPFALLILGFSLILADDQRRATCDARRFCL
jgi:hypothetical protein